MITTSLRLNKIFLILFALTIVYISANEKEAFYNEITTAEEISKENSSIFYCLVLSPKESDKEIISNIMNDKTINQSLQFLFFMRKELYYPTIYLFHNGIIQLRKKVTKELMQDSFDPIYDFINHQTDTINSNGFKLNKTDNARALITLTQNQFMKEDHLKKIIIAIVVVILLSITLILITKYSIDWAISSRLDLNIEKEIRKKEAVDTLIEDNYRRTDMHENNKLEYDYS